MKELYEAPMVQVLEMEVGCPVMDNTTGDMRNGGGFGADTF